mgnify:CR=1 FL=1
MRTEDRITNLNKAFGLIENPNHFPFNNNPDRILCKNKALISNNPVLYENYLVQNHPNHLHAEMDEFEYLRSKLSKCRLQDLKYDISSKTSFMLRADIDFKDSEAIFTLLNISDEDLSWYLVDYEKDSFAACVTIKQAFEGKDFIYLIK